MKDEEIFIKAALEKHYLGEALKPYQAELIKMQRHLEDTGKKRWFFLTAGMPAEKGVRYAVSHAI